MRPKLLWECNWFVRYIDRGPVASFKIEITDDIISYHHDSNHLPTAEFDAVEFLAALSVHIPNIRLRQ